MPDLINGSFELIGAICTWLNVYKLYKDKRVMGISVFSIMFFTAWGFWNLYYYPFLGQKFSFIAGLILVFGNCCWVCLLFYYKSEYYGRNQLYRNLKRDYKS